MSKKGTVHSVLKRTPKKKQGAPTTVKKQRAKQKTALVPAGSPSNAIVKKNSRTPITPAMRENCRRQAHAVLVRLLDAPLQPTFDENMVHLAGLAAQSEAFGKMAYWGIGMRLAQMQAQEPLYGDRVVERATVRLGYKKSLLYCCLAYYEAYSTPAQATKLEELGFEWAAIRELIRVTDSAARDRIVQAVESEKVPPEAISAFVRKKVQEVLGKGKKSTPGKKERKAAEDDLQDSPLTPLAFFRQLEQRLNTGWEPLRSHLEKFEVVRNMVLSDETEESEEAIKKLADCRRLVRQWTDNLAIITRFADMVAESGHGSQATSA